MLKDRNIIAIGGGGFGRNPGEGIIEEYILKQTKKKKPNICFIPTATGDNDPPDQSDQQFRVHDGYLSLVFQCAGYPGNG